MLDATARKFKAGAETGAHGVAFRLGSAVDFRRPEKPLNWSLGLSINRWGKLIHYAYLAQPSLEYKHILSVGATFGPLPKTKTDQSTPNPNQSVLNSNQSISNPDEPTSNTHQSSARPALREKTRQPVTVNAATDTSSTVKIANVYGVELELVLAMVRVESNFQPNAISKSGAVGLTQLMSFTGRELGLKVPNYRNPRKPSQNAQTDERFNPRKNLEAGVRYLSRMIKRYDGNLALAIAAYNAGPGRVKKDVPLMRQTERHVSKVFNHYYRYKSNPTVKDAALHRLDATLNKSLP
ncbi:MAG: lytic transglycosylase domain-containing protein [Candidatus Poribacteria bacterium]|nr:lytic transglycosylase domain-containing protein [Candidatus Poribacteria bacterium]